MLIERDKFAPETPFAIEQLLMSAAVRDRRALFQVQLSFVLAFAAKNR
jgi:hypothetical protein